MMNKLLRNRKGQALWEFTALLAVVLVGCIWFMSTQKTTANKFETGSQQVAPSAESRPFISLINFNSANSPTKQKEVAKSIVQDKQVLSNVDSSTPTLEETFGVSKQTIVNIGHLSFWERIGLDVAIVAVFIFIGGLLDAIGGDCLIEMRRYAMPALISIGISIITFTFHPVWYAWLTGSLVWPVMGTLTLKYMSGDNFGRAEWLWLQSVVFGLFLVVVGVFLHAHLLAWYLYIWYILSTGVWGGLYKNWKQWDGDWITGSWLCSIILYVFLSLLFGL